jgi:hypothetical protein
VATRSNLENFTLMPLSGIDNNLC